ncbi:MAG: helix-turn-helix domain-containing protein, partial [Acidimicrobiales bacterium]
MNEPAEAAVPGRSALESLWSTFEDFGLAGPAARVLCALLQEGSAGASQLAARAGVARTNVYPVLDSLVAGGVAMRVPGPSRVWTTPGWSAVIERLYEAEADRLEMLRSQRDAALALVEELSPEVLSDPLPFVHVLHNAAETRQAYAQLFAR